MASQLENSIDRRAPASSNLARQQNFGSGTGQVMRHRGCWSLCQRPRLQPEKQRNSGPGSQIVPSVIAVGMRFAQRRDRKSSPRQRSCVVFEGLRPTDEMHLQAITFLHAFEAMPAEISVCNNERGVCLYASEAPTVRKWMTGGNDKPPHRTHDTFDFLQCARNILDVHQDVVGHDQIKLGIFKWKPSRRRNRIVTGGLSLGSSFNKFVDGIDGGYLIAVGRQLTRELAPRTPRPEPCRCRDR